MDPAVLALLIPIVAIVCGTVLKALSLRSEGRRPGVSAKLTERLEALEHEVGQLRQELGETQERLDFTERLLAQDRGINRLGPEH
jgi:hypothetical protein